MDSGDMTRSDAAFHFLVNLLRTDHQLVGKHPKLDIRSLRDDGWKGDSKSHGKRWLDLLIAGQNLCGFVFWNGTIDPPLLNPTLSKTRSSRALKGIELRFRSPKSEETDWDFRDATIRLYHYGGVTIDRINRHLRRETTIDWVRSSDCELLADPDVFGKDRILLADIHTTTPPKEQILDFVLRMFRYASIAGLQP